MRIAFFGGTFDPPHCGHIAITRAAVERLNLDQVLVAPVGTQPLKSASPRSGYEDRLAMVRLAVASDPRLVASDADGPLPGGQPNYTYDTLERLRLQLQPADAMFCLLGADSFLTMKQWHRSSELLLLCDFIVAGRPGFSLEQINAALPQGVKNVGEERQAAFTRYTLRGTSTSTANLFLLPDLDQDISATEIRAALAEGAEQQTVLAPAVAEYIRAHGLYRPEGYHRDERRRNQPDRMATTETRRMVLAAAEACEDKKAEDTRILELDAADAGFTDFFLITSGSNERQTQAIADEIELRLKKDFQTYPNSVEGRRQGEWILMDYVDFVVHIFLTEKRAYYDIERLRKSAQKVDQKELKAMLVKKTAVARAKPAKKAAKKTAVKKAAPRRKSATGKSRTPLP